MLGLKCIHDIVVNAMDYLQIDIPVALHLDHGTTREACEAAIEAGFSSIMFDGSHLPFAENRRSPAIWSTWRTAEASPSKPSWEPLPAVKMAS